MYHFYTFVCLWKNRSIYREVVCWRPRHYSYLSFLSFFLGTGWQSVEFSSTSSGALYTNIHMLIFMHFLVWWPKQDSRRERRGKKDISPDVLSAQGVHCWGKGHWLLKQTCEAEPVEGESASKTCDPQNLWAKFIPKKQKRKGTWSSPPEQASVCAWRSAGPSPAASLLGRLLFALGAASQGEANIHGSNSASGTSEDEVGRTETRESERAGTQEGRLGSPSSSEIASNPGFLRNYGLQSLVLRLF